jgi:ABC-type phosphate transport system substrate-binding protein
MLLFSACLLALLPFVAPHENVYALSGSGTTNPSRCYWNIMNKLQARAGSSTRLSYRAVGSTTGIEEFIHEFTTPVIDFASGDIPITTDDFQAMQNAGIEMIHIPVVLGAVSYFHSVPVEQLNLTACLLARIYTGDITKWNDVAIIRNNPNLDVGSLDITVATRLKGSSSTYSTTEVRFFERVPRLLVHLFLTLGHLNTPSTSLYL